MTATQAQHHFDEVIRQVIEDGEPVIVEQFGEPRVAVISLVDLQRLCESQVKEPDSPGQCPDWWVEFERELSEQPLDL
jgi:prevent-host-death family protein